MFSKLSAEFIGTFWLVLGGCGSAVLAAAFPSVGQLSDPLSISLIPRGRSTSSDCAGFVEGFSGG